MKQAEINKEEILKRIKQSIWAQSDETGIRVDGENWQLWTWCNQYFSMYVADKSRGYDVIKENFGEDYQGILIHDCYAAQNKTPAKAHQHCLAHYLRDLKYSIEVEQCVWSKTISSFFGRAVKMKEKIWADNFDTALRQQIIDLKEQFATPKFIRKSQAASEIQKPLNDTPQYFLLSKLPKNKAFHYFMLANL